MEISTVILSLVLIFVWVMGSIFVSLVMGWSQKKTTELLKIIFWPISIFIFNK